MIAENMDGVIFISLNSDYVISGRLDKDTPDKSSVVFEENLRAKHSVLSTDINTGNCVTGGIEDYLTYHYISTSYHEAKLLETNGSLILSSNKDEPL